MNQTDLINEVYRRCYQTKANTRDVLVTLWDVIAEHIEAGDEVKIQGFGTFYKSMRKGGANVCPNTGEPTIYPDVTTMRFKPSSLIKERLNKSE